MLHEFMEILEFENRYQEILSNLNNLAENRALIVKVETVHDNYFAICIDDFQPIIEENLVQLRLANREWIKIEIADITFLDFYFEDIF